MKFSLEKRHPLICLIEPVPWDGKEKKKNQMREREREESKTDQRKEYRKSPKFEARNLKIQRYPNAIRS